MSDISKAQRTINYLTSLQFQFKDSPHTVAHLDVALEALRHMEAINNPQPLTLERLKERIGKPVYVISKDGIHKGWEVVEEYKDNGQYGKRLLIRGGVLFVDNYNFYDHEPGETATLINTLTEDCKRRKCEHWSGTDCTLVAPDTGCPFMGDHEPKEEQR
jgi:hypothetical protein